MSSFPKIALLVAERDGDWSEWVESLRAEADDIAIVLQRVGESPAELATRVRARVATLSLEGDLVVAALVGGERWDSTTLSARSLMIRAMVSQMGSAVSSRLFLDAGARLGRGRHAMQALATVVADQTGDNVDIVTTRGPFRAPVRRAA